MEITYSGKDFFDQGEEVRAFFSSVPSKDMLHCYDFWIISYLYEGTALLHTKTGTTKLSPGDLILIKPHTMHSLSLPSDNSKACAWLCHYICTPKYFDEIFSAYASVNELSCYLLYSMLQGSESLWVKLSDDHAENMKHLIWMIAHEYNHYTVGSDTIMRQTAINLLIYLTRMYEYETTKLSSVDSQDHEMDELAKYIRSHFSYQLSLEYLAQHTHLSREYLSRYFKKHIGKTISQYLMETRIEKAKQMLRTTTYSINDICDYCGYSSLSNFQKAFKKCVGISPSLYRKKELSHHNNRDSSSFSSS